MMKNIRRAILLSTVLFAVGLFVFNFTANASPATFADASEVVCDGSKFIMGGDCDPETGKGLSKIINAVTSVFAWVLGIMAVILIIFGGFKYVTSGGDSNKVSGAKNTIIYAIVGLVVAMLAQPLVKYVIGFFTK